MALLTGRKALLVYTGRKDGLGNRVRALLSAQELARVRTATSTTCGAPMSTSALGWMSCGDSKGAVLYRA